MPLRERLYILKDAGFGVTSLWWEEQREDVRAIRDLAPDLVREAGLSLDHLHVPYFACNELWSESETDRAEAFRLHASWIADCARHAIPRMVMHVTRGKSAPPPHSAALDDFRRLAATAEDAGVTLAIENTHAPGHLDYLFERVPSPALTMCYDSAHDRLHSDSPLALLRRWQGRLSVMHVSDTDGRRDWHWVPGDGNTDFGEIGACFDKPFNGTLMLEAMLRSEEAPKDFARRAHASANCVLNELRSRCLSESA